MRENEEFLKEQIITYLGNKRALLNFIQEGVLFAKKELKKDKLDCVDLFSGSGIVARFLKQHSKHLIANDLEDYVYAINSCYLSNVGSDLKLELLQIWQKLQLEIENNLSSDGFIRKLYSPKNDENIGKNDRVFYTNYNANYIDTARKIIKNHPFEKYFLAPLLYEASVKVNTGGVFRGFYKNKKGIGQFGGEAQNALSRIKGKISLLMPVFSNFDVPFLLFKEDANVLARQINCDLCYIDPPYNQHPYGSNYFMLNLIANYEEPKNISKISGIAKGWNKSVYNAKNLAATALFELISNLKAKIILISYNNEGFINEQSFIKELSKFGRLKVLSQKYNSFKASRNLRSRAIYTDEKLYILIKK